MKDQLIDIEVAILAKEKGFTIHTDDTFYLDRTEWIPENWKEDHVKDLIESDRNYAYKYVDNLADVYYSEFNNDDDSRISRPTQSLLQRWIRETHNLEVEVSKMWHYSLTDDKEMNALTFYRVTVCDFLKPRKDYILYIDKGTKAFHNYEEALEEGLLEALNLIK